MYASIDIGTNTVLLLIAEKSENGLTVIHEEQQVPRLGEGVDEERNLSDLAVNRVIKSLKYFKHLIKRGYPDVKETMVTATSAVRDARNRKKFISRVKKETGYNIHLLSGLKEALFTFRGANSVLSFNSRSTAVVDIGGGSTEIAWGEDGALNDRYSYDMGCVRYTERYLQDDPPSSEQINRCRKAAAEILKEKLFSFPEDITFIGVAGTVTSLSYIALGCDTYNSSIMDGNVIQWLELRDWIENIKGKKAAELTEKYPEVMKGRADIFLAGLLILEQIMNLYGVEQFLVSTGGYDMVRYLKWTNKKRRPEQERLLKCTIRSHKLK